MQKKWYLGGFTAISIFILCFCFFPLKGIAAENAAEEKEPFRVGMEAGYPPFNWTQTNEAHGGVPINGSHDYAGGYDVEIAKIIADKLGRKLEIVKTAWDGLSPALTSGKIDAIIAGMSPTEERKKTIDFTDVYYESHLVIVVNKDSRFAKATSLKDFANAKITAQLNTFHYSVIDQIPGVNKQTAMDDFPAMRVALQSGTIDGYVTEKPEGITAQKKNPNFKMVEFAEGKGFNTSPTDTAIAIGVKQGSPLRAEINQILQEIPANQRTQIMDQAIDNQPDSESNDIWVVRIIKENGMMFLRGAGMTLFISLIGTVVGFLIGLAIGVFRTIPKPETKLKRIGFALLNGFFSAYIEIFRGTPMIVQASVIYYGLAQAFALDINRTVAALFIVSINTGAYMSEIVRGGIFAVDKGQFEAAEAIGMTHFQTMTNVIIPQVIRNILPATGNEFVINIKDTSVLNVISVTELYFEAKTVAGQNLRFFDTFFVACVIYFVMTFTVTRILRLIEKRMDGPDSYQLPAELSDSPIESQPAEGSKS